MELERTFAAPIAPNEARQNVTLFLGMVGFQATDKGNPLVFQRSNRLKTMVATSPDQWQCVATIAIRREGASGSQVRARYEVSTFGQLVTDAERAFFEAELDEIGAALEARAPIAEGVATSGERAALAREQNVAVAERKVALHDTGADPRVVGAVAIVAGAIAGAAEYFSVRGGEYHPKVLLIVPPAILVGFFQVLAGNPERGADGSPPTWWKAGRAGAIVAGLILSALLFWQLG